MPAPTVDAPASLPGHSDLSAVESNYRLYCLNAARIGQQVAEALAVNQLHRAVQVVAVLANIEDRHDVGVVQPRRGLSLATETR